MNPAEIKKKWAKFTGKESAAYQSHSDDLCRLLGVPTPLEADSIGEVVCFQKCVVKDAELLDIEPPDSSAPEECGMDPDQRAQLGAHQTSKDDIRTLVEPVLMAPLRREWAEIKGELTPATRSGKGTAAHRERLAAFLKKLSTITVSDPACGSGNFL